jgi:hypothetical protein
LLLKSSNPFIHPTLDELIIYANKEQEKDREKFLDKSTGQEMEPIGEPQSLLEWFTEKYQEFGAQLEVRGLIWYYNPISDIHSSL